MAGIGPTFFPPLGPATSQESINPQGWDRCTLDGKVIPGHCRILHGGCGLKKDQKKKNGADGENPTYRGMATKPVGMEITTFNDPDREALASQLGPYIPVPGVKPKPVSIDHPSLRLIRVFAVVIEEVDALIPEAGTTKAKMTIAMQHWLPSRKNATATPSGAPTRKPPNVRKKPAQDNPPPTQRKGFAAPPASLGNGQ